MVFIRDIINRRKPFTGRKLLEALELAGRPPAGGSGVEVRSRGSDAVLRATGSPIIPKRAVPIIAGSATSFAANRWQYSWVEGALDGSNAWAPKPGGRSSTDPGRLPARNLAEVLNTAGAVLYGIQLTQPDITVQIFPIPPGAVLFADEQRLPSGDLAYWFYAVNRIDVECAAPLLAKQSPVPRAEMLPAPGKEAPG